MCIKIICSDHEHEFDPKKPLEEQIVGAKSISVNYDPTDPLVENIDHLRNEMVRLYTRGDSFNVDIEVNANNTLNGIKIERRFEKLKRAFDTNELIKNLTTYHSKAEEKLCELSNMCMEKINE
jgi:hypothetical protein